MNSRRLGLILAATATALLADNEGAFACRCMNRLMCGRGCCNAYCDTSCGGCYEATCSSSCQPEGGCNSCGQAAPAATSTAPPPPASSPSPAVAPVQPQAKPDAPPAPTPPPAVEPKSEPKPVANPPELKPPVLAAPKDIETPAEPRAAAKPAEPAVPEKPALASPKAAEPLPLAPTLTPPAKVDEPKPTPPKKPQDDPFGANGASKSLRLWTDASGKYRLEARFVSCADSTVRLQKADGRYCRIKFDRLSAADRDFVLRQGGSLIAAK